LTSISIGDRDYVKSHFNLGVVYNKSGMYKEAIESYKQAIRIEPDEVKAHLNLGLVYFILNDRGSALEQYKILKSLDSELANKLFNSIYE
jgi:tetratricopeptide (TPR) repeat protein